jgi:hypothetical protein
VFIRKTRKAYRGKSYTNYVLVESVRTAKGLRQKIVCSLGSLDPAPREHWRELAHKVHAALGEELAREPAGASARSIADKVQARRARSAPRTGREDTVIGVDTSRVEVEDPREAGAVHVGHQMWRRLELDTILQQAGLRLRPRLLTEAMVLNRLIAPRAEHSMPDWIRRTALDDILGVEFTTLNEDALYRNLDLGRVLEMPLADALGEPREVAEQARFVFFADGAILLLARIFNPRVRSAAVISSPARLQRASRTALRKVMPRQIWKMSNAHDTTIEVHAASTITKKGMRLSKNPAATPTHVALSPSSEVPSPISTFASSSSGARKTPKELRNRAALLCSSICFLMSSGIDFIGLLPSAPLPIRPQAQRSFPWSRADR